MITQSLSPSSEGETFVCGSLRKCMTRSTVAADNELNWKPFSSNYLAIYIDYELTAMTKSTPGIFLFFRFRKIGFGKATSLNYCSSVNHAHLLELWTPAWQTLHQPDVAHIIKAVDLWTKHSSKYIDKSRLEHYDPRLVVVHSQTQAIARGSAKKSGVLQ